MRHPHPIVPSKVRSLPGSFSWIDRRILTGHFLHYLNREEIALYFFLVTASDRQGMSFYSLGKIGHALGMKEVELRSAIATLRELELIAFAYPFFQVLALPERPVLNKKVIKRLCQKEV